MDIQEIIRRAQRLRRTNVKKSADRANTSNSTVAASSGSIISNSGYVIDGPISGAEVWINLTNTSADRSAAISTDSNGAFNINPSATNSLFSVGGIDTMDDSEAVGYMSCPRLGMVLSPTGTFVERMMDVGGLEHTEALEYFLLGMQEIVPLGTKINLNPGPINLWLENFYTKSFSGDGGAYLTIMLINAVLEVYTDCMAHVLYESDNIFEKDSFKFIFYEFWATGFIQRDPSPPSPADLNAGFNEDLARNLAELILEGTFIDILAEIEDRVVDNNMSQYSASAHIQATVSGLKLVLRDSANRFVEDDNGSSDEINALNTNMIYLVERQFGIIKGRIEDIYGTNLRWELGDFEGENGSKDELYARGLYTADPTNTMLTYYASAIDIEPGVNVYTDSDGSTAVPDLTLNYLNYENWTSYLVDVHKTIDGEISSTVYVAISIDLSDDSQQLLYRDSPWSNASDSDIVYTDFELREYPDPGVYQLYDGGESVQVTVTGAFGNVQSVERMGYIVDPEGFNATTQQPEPLLYETLDTRPAIGTPVYSGYQKTTDKIKSDGLALISNYRIEDSDFSTKAAITIANGEISAYNGLFVINGNDGTTTFSALPGLAEADTLYSDFGLTTPHANITFTYRNAYNVLYNIETNGDGEIISMEIA